MNKNIKHLLLAIICLVLLSLACNLSLGSPKYPASPIPVSTEAMGSMIKTLESAQLQAQQKGDINVTLNEAQITSAAAIELQNQEQTFIQNPQIFLRDDQVQVFGEVNYQGINTTAQIILTPSLDPNGQPVFTINLAKIGPLPVPSNFIEDIQTEINRIFATQLGEIVPNARFDQITIADGLLTLTGHTQ